MILLYSKLSTCSIVAFRIIVPATIQDLFDLYELLLVPDQMKFRSRRQLGNRIEPTRTYHNQNADRRLLLQYCRSRLLLRLDAIVSDYFEEITYKL